MAKEAYTPRLTMQKWIEEAPYTASVSSGKLKSLEDLKFKTPIYKEKEDHLFAISIAASTVGLLVALVALGRIRAWSEQSLFKRAANCA